MQIHYNCMRDFSSSTKFMSTETWMQHVETVCRQHDSLYCSCIAQKQSYKHKKVWMQHASVSSSIPQPNTRRMLCWVVANQWKPSRVTIRTGNILNDRANLQQFRAICTTRPILLTPTPGLSINFICSTKRPRLCITSDSVVCRGFRHELLFC